MRTGDRDAGSRAASGQMRKGFQIIADRCGDASLSVKSHFTIQTGRPESEMVVERMVDFYQSGKDVAERS